MSLQVKYGSYTFSPAPLMGVNDEALYADGYQGTFQTITLAGTLTGCSYSDLCAAKTSMVISLSENSYASLIVTGADAYDGGRSYDYCRLESVDFANINPTRIWPYTVNFIRYPNEFWEKTVGVIEPSNKWSVSEQLDKTLQVTHTVSAKAALMDASYQNGYGSNLDNIKAFVNIEISDESFLTSLFQSRGTTQMFLKSDGEGLNVLDGTYSRERTYILGIAQDEFSSTYLVRYSAEISKSDGGYVSVTLRGSIESGLLDATDLTESMFTKEDAYLIAKQIYESAKGTKMSSWSGKLVSKPVSYSYTKDTFEHKINFSFIFDDDETVDKSDVILEYEVAFQNDLEGNFSSSIDGVVRYVGFLEDKSAIMTLLEAKFSEFDPKAVLFGTSIPLIGATGNGAVNNEEKDKALSKFESFTSESITKDYDKPEIQFNYEYNLNNEGEGPFETLSVSIGYSVMIGNIYSAIKTINGDHCIFDIGSSDFGTQSLSLNGTYKTGVDAYSQATGYLEKYVNQFSPKNLYGTADGKTFFSKQKQKSETHDEKNRTIEYNYSWITNALPC